MFCHDRSVNCDLRTALNSPVLGQVFALRVWSPTGSTCCGRYAEAAGYGVPGVGANPFSVTEDRSQALAARSLVTMSVAECRDPPRQSFRRGSIRSIRVPLERVRTSVINPIGLTSFSLGSPLARHSPFFFVE